jgi:hypothetical protein
VKKNRSTSELEQFRQSLYQNFNNRADTLMELVDALCSNIAARTAVELTLAPYFRRTYSALYKAVDEYNCELKGWVHLLARYLPAPQQRPFWLLGVDVTTQSRPYAKTLSDRGMVYQPNLVKGNKPVTVGHQYSTVALLPEAEANLSPSWLVPLTTERVATTDDKELVGAVQIETLLNDRTLPFHKNLCVDVGDSSYSKAAYLGSPLGPNRHHPNLVTLARVRSTRTFYQQPCVCNKDETVKKRGHPTWYGAPFSLQDPATWHSPDETVTLTKVSCRGKRYRVEIQAWHHMLMRGKQKPKSLPMHQHPFTLVCITSYDEEGQQVGKHPLWLIVIGKRRHELSLSDSYHAYEQRYDLEHFFRFGKQKLLLTGFQTPETDREETWWRLVHLAYAQLWMARHVAVALPRPWERNLPTMRQRLISPTLVQRDFARIIRQLGTPATPPKPRGISPGRRKGMKLPKRPRQTVVVKSQKAAQAA